MRVAVVFDTYSEWDHPEHKHQKWQMLPRPDWPYGDFIQRIVEAAMRRYERS
jgi:beta-xylosidase